MNSWDKFKNAGAGRIGRFLKPAFTFNSRGRLPQTTGRLTLSALTAPVTIQRDRWGIPQINAQNRHDLFLAQGFVHAQDRLWQMEINRRAAAGRLAELLGPMALATDRLTRTLGFTRLAEMGAQALSIQAHADLSAYAAGVNALLEGGGPLPLELALLGHRPAPWTPLDSIAFARLQLWAMSYGGSAELVRAQLLQKVGADLAAELEPVYPERNPVTLPAGVEFNELATAAIWQATGGPFIGRGSEGGGRGSNGVVISGRRTVSGQPLLANDLHLPVTTPALWYFNYLCSADGMHVTGVSQPGLPYVMVGHNERIAWGITLALADVEDLFIERLHPDRPNQYQFGTDWRPLDIQQERISVRGRPDEVLTIRRTHHGPIISDVLGHDPGDLLALASTALEAGITFDGFGLLNEAKDWQTFTAAVARIQAPPLNVLYADTANNIGYYISGRVPQRARGQGLVPAPGFAGTHEWTGIIPFAEMPHAFNPEQGYIVSANNRPVGDDYPHYLGSTWRNGFRARRLVELIEATPKISAADCRAWQLDVLSEPGQALVAALADLDPADPDAAQAYTILQAWDGQMSAESAGAVVYKLLITRLAHVILGRHLAPELLVRFLGEGEHELLAPINEYHGYWPATLLRMLSDDSSGWLPGGFGREAVINRALAETGRQLRRQLGEDTRRWQWGRLHQVRFPHIFDQHPLLAPIFDQGAFPIGGDAQTVMQTAVRPAQPFANNAFSVSYRQVVDLGDSENSTAIFPPGQSGELGSEHYGDLVPSWLAGHYFHMPWTQATVNANRRETLELLPIDRKSLS